MLQVRYKCVPLPTCIIDKTNTKQTHTIIIIFILHSLKFAAVCMLPLTAAARKLSTVSDSLFSQQNSGIESIHSGAPKNDLGVEDRSH